MKVSAIITTFNRAHLLGRAIISVLNQTHRDFELIILDNNSTDNTKKVVAEFKNKRIRYICHKPMAISEARNFGIQEASGDFVAFLDDDDEWLPQKLEKQLQIFNNSPDNVGLVYCGWLRVNPNNKIYQKQIPSKRGYLFPWVVLHRNTLTGAASVPMIKKSVYKKIGLYDVRVKTYEDYELYLRLARFYDFDFTPEPLVKIYEHKGYRLSDANHDQKKLETELLVFNQFKDIIEKNKSAHSYYMQIFGGLCLRLNNFRAGRRYLVDAVKINPLNFVAYLQLLFSFGGVKFYKFAHSLYKIFR